MTRKKIKQLILSAILAVPWRVFSQNVPPESRPNVLFIAIDDMNDWTGFLGGHPQAVTPNMDRLARRGVNFTNAHCSAPGCSPSRNSLLYGVEPFNSGLYLFYDQAELPKKALSSYTSLIRFFKENGYNTYGSGKIHHLPVITQEEWTEYSAEKKSSYVFDETNGYRQGKSWKMNFTPTLNPKEELPDYQTASYAVDVLQRKHDRPFFLAAGLVKPHLPFVCPKEFFDLYPDPVLPPKINPDDFEDIPWVGRAMIQRGDDARFKKDNAWNKVRRAYLACISWTDYNAGRVLDALAASPYADNTVVVLWSDHGFALGEKNHFTKFALWEETTRVPFIIWDARDKQSPEGRICRSPVSLINIYRTLADLAGLAPPEYVAGNSLTPQLKNTDAPVNHPAICTWGRGNYAVRDTEWRYIRYFDGSEELYSHSSDPEEWTNLAGNPEYNAIKKRLAAAIPKKEAPLVVQGLEFRNVVDSDAPSLDEIKQKWKPGFKTKTNRGAENE